MCKAVVITNYPITTRANSVFPMFVIYTYHLSLGGGFLRREIDLNSNYPTFVCSFYSILFCLNNYFSLSKSRVFVSASSISHLNLR